MAVQLVLNNNLLKKVNAKITTIVGDDNGGTIAALNNLIIVKLRNGLIRATLKSHLLMLCTNYNCQKT